MLTLPKEIMAVVQAFAPVFSPRIWDWAQVLLVGAILTPKQRTVTAILRVMGLSQERQFQNYHRVLNRARWSGMKAAAILLGLLVSAFWTGQQPLVLAADDTLERRRGDKISAKGQFRDPVLSSRGCNVSSPGLRWVSLMLLTAVPWSRRLWALPFLTVLALHPKTNAALGRRHKTVVDWVRQLILVARRWLPAVPLVLLTDGALISVKLGLRCRGCRHPVTFVSRLPLNARLFDPPAAKPAGKRGAQARLGARQPNLQSYADDAQTVWTSRSVNWYGGQQRLVEIVTGTALWHTPSTPQPLPLRWVLIRDPRGKFKPTALCCSDVSVSAEQIIAWYVLRWNVEVTFEEVRAHLGLETQRQWSDLAIARTTPILLGLFSLVTLLAHRLVQTQPIPIRAARWYTKTDATFVDVLACVRGSLWRDLKFLKSPRQPGFAEIPRDALALLVETLAYAA